MGFCPFRGIRVRALIKVRFFMVGEEISHGIRVGIPIKLLPYFWAMGP